MFVLVYTVKQCWIQTAIGVSQELKVLKLFETTACP